MQTEVLIVGAGPTGLMLANQLARRGIKPLIIDRHSGPAQQTRAMAVHARTLEIYAKMGIAEEAIARGARGTGASIWANGRWTARIPFGDIGAGISPFPFVLTLGQDDNERVMGAHLNKLGMAVQWGTELVSLDQKFTHVDVGLRLPNGSHRMVRAAWVAGCDGSRSPVRELNGIDFPGAPYEHTFFVADTEAIGPMKPGELNMYLWRDGFHLFFPTRGKDRWRVIGILPEPLRGRDEVTFASLVPSIRAEAGTALDFKSCSWFSTYRIQHRAAERFRLGRCFLLGDAAHIHSPMGGQGMNTGLQDAYNLAWKLALVVEGRADSALLDTYEQERLPVATQLLKTTDRAFQQIVSDTWLARLMRTRLIGRVAARAMTFERARKLAFRTLSQTGIRYPDSALSQTGSGLPKGAPAPGDRFPWLHLQMFAGAPPADLFQALDDRRFNLVVFDPAALKTSALKEFHRLLTVHVIPSTRSNAETMSHGQIPPKSFYLLRPDGHVGLCGSTFDEAAIRDYLLWQVRLHTMNEDTAIFSPPERATAA